MLHNLTRKIEFARHIPLSKLARRIELSIRRKLRDKLSPRFDRNSESFRNKQVPPPIFFPRTDLGARVLSTDTIELSFLNRAVRLDLTKLDWNSPGPGAENQLLRMNLHYMEYLEGTDNNVWSTLVSDWIENCGLGAAGAWRDSWNSYALSIRVVVWMQELARRKEQIPFEIVEAAERSILNQVLFLEQNLETDIGGNHLIKNVKALLWASAYFEGVDADRWRRIGLACLKKELKSQILPDGMHYERSPSYHCQVFADLLECRAVMDETPLRDYLDCLLVRMAQVTMDLTHPDGFVAQFNDAGLRMAYAPSECLRVYQDLGLVPVSPSSTIRLDHAGYFGARFEDTFLVLDCGAIAPDELPAHGHGDVLSFEWSIRGERVIVDPGVFEYIEGERRKFSRTAASHNTLCIIGADQAEFFGAFRCGRRPKVDVLKVDLRSDRMEISGQHDGFSHLPGKPIHKRVFQFEESVLRVIDSIQGSTDRPAEIGFLLHPDVQVRLQGNELILSSGSSEIFVSSDVPLTVETSLWWPDMGVEFATKKLLARLGPEESGCETRFEIRQAT